VFATFGVVDHDGDVTRPGAFANGTPVIIGSYGHRTAEPPIGKGVIWTSPTEASVEGTLFLDTTHGRDAYATLKGLGALAEWSYVFAVKRSSYGQHDGKRVRFLEEIEVYSVDPVLKGAGIGTRTVAIKNSAATDHRKQLARGRERFEVSRAFQEAKATLAENARREADLAREVAERAEKAFHADHPRVPEDLIWGIRQIAAKNGARAAAKALGVPVPEIEWFRTRPGADTLFGFTFGEGSKTIHLNSDLEDLGDIFSTACHEVSHVKGFGEADAQEFEAIMLERAEIEGGRYDMAGFWELL
jgi:hypothetical protein